MQRQIKKLIVIVLLLFSSTSYTTELKHPVGIGLQYGGVLGWQGSLSSGENSARLGLGVVGFTVGYDRIFSESFSVGVQVFGNYFNHGAGISMNYYLGVGRSSHWVLGLDVFRAKLHLEEIFGEVIPNQFETGAFVSLGYRF